MSVDLSAIREEDRIMKKILLIIGIILVIAAVFWVGKGMESWEGSWGVTWMRCTTDGRVWLESDWSGAWDLRIRAEL